VEKNVYDFENDNRTAALSQKYGRRVDSCIFEGGWLFYKAKGYGKSRYHPFSYYFKDSQLERRNINSPFNIMLGSIKKVNEDPNILVVYKGDDMTEQSKEYYGDAANIVLPGRAGRSVQVNPGSIWMIYSEEYFGGKSQCVYAWDNGVVKFYTSRGLSPSKKLGLGRGVPIKSLKKVEKCESAKAKVRTCVKWTNVFKSVSSTATDQWCFDNCTHNPPYCPSTYCKKETTCNKWEWK